MSYLLSLPLAKGSCGFEDGVDITPRQLQYLFQRHAAALLGWVHQIPKGDINRFSNEVNTALCVDVYLDGL